MKVLHVIGAYVPTTYFTGPAQQLHALCVAQRREGVDARVLTTEANGPTPLGVVVDTWTECDGVPVYYGRRVPGTLQLSFALHREIRRIAFEFDLVHATGMYAWSTVAAAEAATRADVPFVLAPRGGFSSAALSFRRLKKRIFFAAAGNRVIRSVEGFHATSTAERDDIAAFAPGRPIGVIPNGVALPLALTKRTAPDVAGGRTVLYLGRLHRIKNLSLLLDAFATIRGTHAGARLVLAGPDDDHLLDSLQKESAALGLTDAVTFTGRVSGEEKESLFRQAACLVLPSQSENFGNVVAEALVRGLPVIASTGTPWEALVRCGAGWWVAPERVALAGALDAALSTPAESLREMGLRGRAYAETELAWPALARRMTAYYDELLAGRRSRRSPGQKRFR